MARSISNAVEERKPVGRAWPLLLGLTLLVVLSVVAGCGAGTSGQSPEPADKEAGGNGEDSSGGGKLERPSLGEADAPVVMTEYSDYQ